jgi:DNA invertase Pin-like site-specific DNA recombinase
LAADREGFQKLVAEGGMGHAGLVIGLEVSRLARNSSDWHRLLEICAFTDTLILDEDGLYDPGHFNDRLLLGLKGTMSEAELHVMHARMRGGLLSKARRGELQVPLPVGFLYDGQGQVILDPDQQVQQSIRFLFQSFRRPGSAGAVVKAFCEAKLLFSHRPRGGPQDGELLWVRLGITQTLFVLHNPRCAGAFVYGRTRTRRTLEGAHLKRLPQKEWHTLLRGAHAGYIQYCSLKHLDALGVVELSGTRSVTSAEREVAHLALDAARDLATAARHDPFIQNLGENRLMKRFPVLRGE